MQESGPSTNQNNNTAVDQNQQNTNVSSVDQGIPNAIGPNVNQPNNAQFTPAFNGAQNEDAELAQIKDAVQKRLKKLRQFLPSPKSQAGGFMGRVAHLSSYTWEGVGISMLFVLVAYLIRTLVLNPELVEQAIYQELPEDLKFKKNEEGDYPVLYKSVIDGTEVTLTKEILDPKDVTEIDIWANGFMPEPTREMGLRNRFKEMMEEMWGSYEEDPTLETVMQFVKGPMSARSNPASQNPNPAEFKLINPNMRPGRS